jgi:Leucine-rich repeat (LRR) protein
MATPRVSTADAHLCAHCSLIFPLPLNKHATLECIDNLEFRNSINKAAGSRSRLRLNLGGLYKRYKVNGFNRDEINRLVENPEAQIWSDITELYLGGEEVKDISEFAGLTNLQELNLKETQVTDISKLAGLTNLRKWYLKNTEVDDGAVLAGLTNMCLYR